MRSPKKCWRRQLQQRKIEDAEGCEKAANQGLPAPYIQKLETPEGQILGAKVACPDGILDIYYNPLRAVATLLAAYNKEFNNWFTCGMMSEDYRDEFVYINTRETLRFMLRRLRLNMADALSDFVAEAVYEQIRVINFGAKKWFEEQGLSYPEFLTDTSVIRTYLKDVTEARKERMNARKRGGGNRSKFNWTDEECKRFAGEVDKWHGLWKFIVKFYQQNSDDNQWMASLKEQSKFRSLTVHCTALTDKLLARVADWKLDKRKREPLALAFEHARRELHLPPHSVLSLERYYRKGKKTSHPPVIE